MEKIWWDGAQNLRMDPTDFCARDCSPIQVIVQDINEQISSSIYV